MTIPYQFGMPKDIKRDLYQITAKHSKRVDALKRLPQSDLIIDVFKHYISHCIPTPDLLENKYWMSSAFPSDSDIPIRININWHEVFRIEENVEQYDEKVPFWLLMVFTDKEVLNPKALSEIKQLIPQIEADPHFTYESGLPVQQAIFLPLFQYFTFVSYAPALESMRKYNHNLMQRGKKVHTGHNYLLASLAFEQ